MFNNNSKYYSLCLIQYCQIQLVIQRCHPREDKVTGGLKCDNEIEATVIYFGATQVQVPRISYRSRVIAPFSIRPSTSVLWAAGRILIRVLEANLYLALFLWSPWGMSLNIRWAVW